MVASEWCELNRIEEARKLLKLVPKRLGAFCVLRFTHLLEDEGCALDALMAS